MGAAYFYHLTRSPIENTLPLLLGKALDTGWRVVVRGVEPARMEWLDQKLWEGPAESFLPHGIAGGPDDAAQPILLSTTAERPNGAVCVMTLDGAPVEIEEVQLLERVCILFDGGDPAALEIARDQWKSLAAAGCALQYWTDEAGRWEKKRES